MTSAFSLLESVQLHTKTNLRPHIIAIDREKYYPENFLRELGVIGGFSSLVSQNEGGSGLGVMSQIAVIREIGRECGSTAFVAWCQSACIWYVRQTRNETLKKRYLADLLQGKVLAGTGMSNTVKHLSGIEKNFLKAKRVAGGYLINGGLPWVSNLGKNHVFATTAILDTGEYVMFMLRCNEDGVSLKPCPEFCALEGTRTMPVTCRDVLISDDEVLAQPDEFSDYIIKIKAGFILLQMGIGAGIIDDCIRIARDSNQTNGEINAYLDDNVSDLQRRFDAILAETAKLAAQIDDGHHEILAVLKLRAEASELSLIAAQSAALHAGAKGYLMHHPAQRRVREAMFVAIVTPALKHLRKEIAELQKEAA